MTQSITPELHQFLTKWRAWVKAGAPPRKPFLRTIGLCNTATEWAIKQFADPDSDPAWDAGARIHNELYELFDRLNYPFGGEARYYNEVHNATIHLNPERLAWVERILEENPHG